MNLVGYLCFYTEITMRAVKKSDGLGKTVLCYSLLHLICLKFFGLLRVKRKELFMYFKMRANLSPASLFTSASPHPTKLPPLLPSTILFIRLNQHKSLYVRVI